MHPSIITFSGMWLEKNRFSDTLMLTKRKVTDEERTYIGTMQMQYSSSILLD